MLASNLLHNRRHGSARPDNSYAVVILWNQIPTVYFIRGKSIELVFLLIANCK